MENINTYDNGAEGMILNISDMIVSNITSENNA
jgi:hypothetical protein